MCVVWVHECTLIHKLYMRLTGNSFLIELHACMLIQLCLYCFHFWKKKMSSLKQICINILSHVVKYLGVKYLLSLNWIVLKLNWFSINEIFNPKLFSWFYRKNIRKRLIFPVQQRLRFIRLSGKFSKTYMYRMIEKIEIYQHNFTIVYSYNLVTSCSEVVLFLAS